MATTVNNSSLTTGTNDRIILNGVTYGSTTSVDKSNCDEVYNRIMTIPAYAESGGTMTQDFVSILSATASPNSAGDVDIAKFQYGRITNLDDTYPIWVKVTDNVVSGSVAATYVVQVPAGTSYIVHSPTFFANSRDIDAQAVEKARVANREFVVSAVAAESSINDDPVAGCDIEVFVVTK